MATSPIRPVPDHPITAEVAPLSNQIIFVDVKLEDGSDVRLLAAKAEALGARVRQRLTSDVTHIVFAKGTTTRVRLRAHGAAIVTPMWIHRCEEMSSMVSTGLYEANTDAPRLKRRRDHQPKEVSVPEPDDPWFSSSQVLFTRPTQRG